MSYQSSVDCLNLEESLGLDENLWKQRFADICHTVCGTEVKIKTIESRGVEAEAPKQCVLDSTHSAMIYLDTCDLQPVRTRIISLCQKNSLQPFLITGTIFQDLLVRFKVPESFLGLLFNFYQEIQTFEGSYAKVVSLQSPSDAKCFDFVYQLKYPEPNSRQPRFSWSVRRTEVHHRVSFETAYMQNFFLVLHPSANSKADRKLGEKAQDVNGWRQIEKSPVRLDLLIVSAYIDNWHPSLTDLARMFHDQRKFILTADFNDVRGFQDTMNFVTATALQALEEQVQAMPDMLRSSLTLIDHLNMINQTLHNWGSYDDLERNKVHQALSSMRVRVEGYLATAIALEARINSLAKLVSTAMVLRAQATTADINDRALLLTKESIEDNSVVKLATLATLFYLPGSFVASIFGMNYFDFQDNSATMKIANNFWVYWAVTIPLTICTGMAWFVAVRQQKRKQPKYDSSEKNSGI